MDKRTVDSFGETAALAAENRNRARSERIYSIQFLRGLAATIVVIAHIIEHPLAEAPEAAIRTGRFGVEIFFVISGFIIAEVAGPSAFSPGKFALRRLWRVAPLYMLCTLAVYAATLVVPEVFKTTVSNFPHFLRSLFFIPSADPTAAWDWRPTFKIGWTINYEMFFYLVMTFLFWCHSRGQRALMLTGVMGLLIATSFLIAPKSSVIAFYANLNLLPFIVGVWVAQLRSRGALDELPTAGMVALIVLTVAAVALFYLMQTDDLSRPGPHLVMALAAALLVITVLSLEEIIPWHRLRIFLAVGDWSYSLYLMHMFVIGAGVVALRKLGISGPAFWAGMSFVFVGCLATAWAAYTLFERPMNRFGARRFR